MHTLCTLGTLCPCTICTPLSPFAFRLSPLTFFAPSTFPLFPPFRRPEPKSKSRPASSGAFQFANRNLKCSIRSGQTRAQTSLVILWLILSFGWSHLVWDRDWVSPRVDSQRVTYSEATGCHHSTARHGAVKLDGSKIANPSPYLAYLGFVDLAVCDLIPPRERRNWSAPLYYNITIHNRAVACYV